MSLNLTDQAVFTGPALPAPFVRFELENELNRLKLLPRTTGLEGRELQASWESYRRKLRELVSSGGALRVRNHVLEPLLPLLGYDRLEEPGEVQTREGWEAGGTLLVASDGSRLRTWATSLGEDLDAPARRGRAYRFSHVRIAQRVLLACNERLGLVTNGYELRLLICDPARPDSQVEIKIDPDWKRSRDLPDSFRFLLAIASPPGVKAVPDIVEKARLQQTRVTRELRVQARQAVEGFIQEVLDHPDNLERLGDFPDKARLAKDLWREGLVTVYRLLFILKLESSDDPARSFTFSSTSLWRNSFSPSIALARYARDLVEIGAETGHLLEDGIRMLFRAFAQGLECTGLRIKPLGGGLFGEDATPLLSQFRWGERAVAHLLDRLLWTPKKRGGEGRERVHYGPLDVEDLGRVYEALLELEPGISTETMCRLRRQKLEVVVPVAQGERYRTTSQASDQAEATELTGDGIDEPEDTEEEAPAAGKKTKVDWIEEIPSGRFYLRVGLGRKSTGSYYTPHSFVRFLVQETLGPQVTERSPQEDPRPAEILKLKVLDPAMGSGHFLVEACRFLGEKLYEACRLCDERALGAERRAETEKTEVERARLWDEVTDYRRRIDDLPDPDDEIVQYLPSRAPEGEESGLSQKKAEALCRRLVAVHCLYGVDKNPLAVELAKLALWIESHAEGLPLTFLDHRLVVGDSLTGPFFKHLLKYPGSQKPLNDLFTKGLAERLTHALAKALESVRDLEASVGINLVEVQAKLDAKARLDRALAPFRLIAAAWAGAVMLGPKHCDDRAYARLVEEVVRNGAVPAELQPQEGTGLPRMIALGLGRSEWPPCEAASVPALPPELQFPEVFYPGGRIEAVGGFDTVVGNPPWDRMLPADKEFFASYQFDILNAPTKKEREAIEKSLLQDDQIRKAHDAYISGFRAAERSMDALYEYQVVEIDGEKTIGKQDVFRLFMERNARLLNDNGFTGVLVPSAFHANEGATGIRRLYLNKMALRFCYSFENRRALFEIHRSFKFALVIARPGGPSKVFTCGFYLHDDECLFGDRAAWELSYSLDFVNKTGGAYLTLLELRSKKDLDVALTCFSNGQPFGHVCERLGIKLGRELNMTDDAWRFTSKSDVLSTGTDPRDPDQVAKLVRMGYLPLHEGKTFHQYTDRWAEPPRFVVVKTRCQDKPAWLRASCFFRLQFREIARATDERTVISSIESPGFLNSYTATNERTPWKRPDKTALWLTAVLNSFPFDWCARQSVQIHLTLAVLKGLILPFLRPCESMLVHSALRLACNHAGYAPLWLEQMGGAWRETKVPCTWPVIATDDERWAVRAAIDALVADAYGLSHEQYEHVLSAFSHKSYPKAPDLCLARFDKLKAIGLEAFTKEYDPYWDIPLNEALPEPVIDLPVPAETEKVKGQSAFRFENEAPELRKVAEPSPAYGEQQKRRGRPPDSE